MNSGQVRAGASDDDGGVSEAPLRTGSTPAAAGKVPRKMARLTKRHLREPAAAGSRRWSFPVASPATVRHQPFENVWQLMQSIFLSVTCFWCRL